MSLPSFDTNGCLSPGDFPMTFSQLRESMPVLGPAHPSQCPNWDARWWHQLLQNAEILTSELWQAGLTNSFLDGSFVEDKDHPNDIDGYFECSIEHLMSGQLEQDLNRISEAQLWTCYSASRRPHPGFAKLQLPMWHHHRVELYPHAAGVMSGIDDEWENDLEFPAAFRRSRRDGRQRGIIQIIPESNHDP